MHTAHVNVTLIHRGRGFKNNNVSQQYLQANTSISFPTAPSLNKAMHLFEFDTLRLATPNNKAFIILLLNVHSCRHKLRHLQKRTIISSMIVLQINMGGLTVGFLRGTTQGYDSQKRKRSFCYLATCFDVFA